MAPVGSVLPRRAIATLPPASRSAMIPDPTTVASSRAVPSVSAARGREIVSFMDMSALADLGELLLQAQPVERIHRQVDEDADAIVEHAIGIGKGQMALGVVAGGLGGIGHAPMRRHRLARPDRTDFVGGIIADGEYEIELGGAVHGKFIPALRAQIGGPVVELPEEIDRVGMHLAFGMAAGAERLEFSSTVAVEDGFGHDRSGRVAGA